MDDCVPVAEICCRDGLEDKDTEVVDVDEEDGSGDCLSMPACCCEDGMDDTDTDTVDVEVVDCREVFVLEAIARLVV